MPTAQAAPPSHPARPESAHTLANTGAHKYLVTEFDSGTGDEQSALIWHLKTFAPLAMVFSSGGKSLHSWWNCEGIAEDKLVRFMHYAVSLGADAATCNCSQFVRLLHLRVLKRLSQCLNGFNTTSSHVARGGGSGFGGETAIWA
jgi:hypothetical protein